MVGLDEGAFDYETIVNKILKRIENYRPDNAHSRVPKIYTNETIKLVSTSTQRGYELGLTA